MILVKSYYGPCQAKIALVGEAPGKTEEIKGRPFCGASGNLLETMLNDAGISMSLCHLMNIMEFRPPNNNFGEFYHDKKRREPKKELQIGIFRLKEELRALKPNLIIGLGSEALRALTGKVGIQKWRGTVHQTELGKVLCTYHPASILRNYANRPIAQIDLTRARSESYNKRYEPCNLTCRTGKSFEETMDILSRIREGICAFDIETLGRHVRCLGLSLGPNDSICIPFLRLSHAQSKSKILLNPTTAAFSYWTEKEEHVIVQELSRLFLRPEIDFVAQNFSFDMPLLEMNFGLRIRNFYLDTMHAQHIAYPEFPKSLDFLTSVYTKIGYYADYDGSSDVQTWLYNCHDVMATHQCVKPILKELDQLGLRDFYFYHVHPLVKTMTSVQSQGVLIDVKRRKEIGKPCEKELKDLKAYFKKEYNLDFNLQLSPKQVIGVLRKHNIPIPTKYDKGTRKETTDERALRDIEARYPEFEFIKKLREQREKQKFYGTYISAKLDEDGRFRTSYNVSGTRTGRLSSSQTVWKTGGNLQNIPKSSFRRLFTVPLSRTLLHADLSQAETRLVAWLSKDKDLIERFICNPHFDVHRFNATRIFDTPEHRITANQRQRGKACNHSGNYGISWEKFAYIAGLSYKDAKECLAKHQANPNLQRWWKEIQEKLREDRTIITPKPFQRKRIFYGRLDQGTFREAYNFVPQSTVGDIINEACWKIDATIDKTKARIILQVHDEIDLEVEKSYLSQAIKIVRFCMQIELSIHKDLPKLLIPVDLAFGPNWYDLEKTE